jgi:hypothetical protein
MLSVMTPVNVCLPGAAVNAATTTMLQMKGFMQIV